MGLIALAVTAVANNLEASSCECGFYDQDEDNLWTDSVIVYFNETSTIPEDIFFREDYRNRYQQGWNSRFIQGSLLNNSWISNTNSKSSSAQKSLQLTISPSDAKHIVMGGSIRTQRQDIQYGSFRAVMKGPPPFTGGSSLSMSLEYNLTSKISLDIMNTAKNDTAWFSTLINHEFFDRRRGVNFANITDPDFGANPLENPWAYNEMRIDWTPKLINYWLGKNLSRSITDQAADGSDRPSVPVPLTFKHWSDGNEFAMQGPPMHNETEASVLYVRAFFNTTSMNSTSQAEFNARCTKSTACSTENPNLRGSTAYPPEATNFWYQAGDQYVVRWPAVGIMTVALLMSISTLANVFFRRVILPSEPKVKESPAVSEGDHDNNSQEGLSFTSGGTTPLAAHRSPFMSGYATPATMSARTIRSSSASNSAIYLPNSQVTRPSSLREEHDIPPVPRLPYGSVDGSPYTSASASRASLKMGTEIEASGSISPPEMPVTPFSPTFSIQRNLSFIGRPPAMFTFAPAVIGDTGDEEVIRGGVIAENIKGKTIPISSSAAPTGETSSGGKLAPRQKIDYLAGLLAICSTLVSVTHFMLTFLPATIIPGEFAHYESENWARKLLGWFLFNEIWVVLFFTTSSRFLTTRYLRTGDLGIIAEKTTSRTFRLMIPIMGVIILEYFLMDVGATDWLQNLASVSWSTWPYTVVYHSFGSFVSEALELVYLVPNAQPQITFNFCTGVLWTIPVQLDGSWIAMLGVVVFYEIKNPYKRFSYYFIVILTHWYARSWGGLFIAGLCMADLDVSYKYRKSLYANVWVYYPLLNLVIVLALASLANDLISTWTGINFQVIEDGWHIDKVTGQTLAQAGRDGFPPYFVPKLNSLTFAICAQLLVEWSTVVQKFLSLKVVLWLFPHIFTIYLFHGFIFWSIGSWVCIGMSGLGVPYWVNMVVTALACYTSLFLCLPIITPVVEALGKSVTVSIWAAASEAPAPKRATTFPFPKDLFTSRNLENPTEPSETDSSASSTLSDKLGKDGMKSNTSTTDSSASSLTERSIPPGEIKWPLVNEKPVPF